MKKGVLIVFIFWNCLALSWSQSLDTRIDFSIANANVVQALSQLTDQGKIEIAYSSRFFTKEKKITLELSNTKIKTVLEKILENTQVGFQMIGQQIVLSKKAPAKNKHYILSGYIEYADSGEKLIAASVFDEQTGAWCLSNEYGFFSLKVPAGTTMIRVTYLGTKEIRKEMDLQKNRNITFQLENVTTLSEVLVTPQKEITLIDFHQDGTKIPAKFKEVVPDLAGESDVLRTAQLLPGVQSGVDGFGGLFVRGGDSGQNLMLLDGVPVYNPFHVLGVFSIFNTHAIRDARVLRGFFPARYGGKISSVVDVHIREGNDKEWEASAAINLLSGNVSLEGPLIKDKCSILLTGRKSFFESFLLPAVKKTFTEDNDASLGFNFYDINAKINYAFSDKDRLLISYYQGRDNFESDFRDEIIFPVVTYNVIEKGKLEWGNQIAAIRWNHQFGPRLFSNTTATYSFYQYQSTTLGQIVDNAPGGFYSFIYIDTRSNIKDLAIKTDIDFLLSPQHTIRFGAELIEHEFQPLFIAFDEEDNAADLGLIIPPDEPDTFTINGLEIITDEVLRKVNYRSNEAHVYFEDDWQLSSKWRINLGGRFSYFASHDGAKFMNFEPRVSAHYSLNPSLSFRTSISRMVQYLHLVANTKVRNPRDIWLPSSKELSPQKSWQGDIAVDWIFDPSTKISLEAYYKNIEQVQIMNGFDELDILDGTAWAYGSELLVERKHEKFGGWMSYALAWSKRKYPGYNLSLQFPFRHDRRHQVKLFAYYQIEKNLRLSANWIYESANPQIIFYTEEDREDIPWLPSDLGKENLVKSRANHRLDVALTYQINKGSWEHQLKLGAYNLYDRKNTAFYKFSRRANGELIERPVSLLPFIPSLSYSLRF